MYPQVRISPFIPQAWEEILNAKNASVSRTVEDPEFWLNGAGHLQYHASGRDALRGCLKNLRLRRQDEVLIVKNTEGPYVSGCVTKTIEKICRWSQQWNRKTRCVLVIHEFGFPCPIGKILPYTKNGIPIIEDCAYALGSRIGGAAVGTIGDYAVYSLPKIYPIPFGGILVAKTPCNRTDHNFDIPADFKELLRQTLRKSHSLLPEWNRLRRENWLFFAKKLFRKGLKPYFSLSRGIVPGVYVTHVPKNFSGEKVKQRLNSVGVESTQYYGQQGFYFPLHQFLTAYEKEYIVHHFLSAL